MGHLLSSAIKMQGTVPTTATINISNDGDLNTCGWYKNGVSQGTVPDLTSVSATLNAGDTFYVYASNVFFGATIDYILNGAYNSTFTGDPIAQTSTFTAAANNTYTFSCYGGA